MEELKNKNIIFEIKEILTATRENVARTWKGFFSF